jgi:hypothetical protein
MEITVTVDTTGIDLATPIGQQYGEDGPEARTVGDEVVRQIVASITRSDGYSGIPARLRELRDEEIREQIRPIVAAAVSEPLQRTNEYGRPVGDAKPLTELIVEEVRSYLKRRADNYDRTGRTVVQKLIADEVDRVVTGELRQAIADEKAKVVAAVRAKAADLIATAVKEGVGR